MIKPIKTFCLILFFVSSVCGGECTEPVCSNNSGLLYQVRIDSKPYYEYAYNDLNQIVEEKSKQHYTMHHYENGGLVSSVSYVDPGMYSSSFPVADAARNRKEWVNPTNTKKSGTTTHVHDANGKIIKSEGSLSVSEFSYDDKNRVNRRTFYRDSQPASYTDYLYDDNNNLIKRLEYQVLATGDSVLQTTFEYEFDDKHNPYKAFNSLMQPGRYTNTNNIVKETRTFHFDLVGENLEKVRITENTYTYNSQGYPISKNGSETYFYY